MQPATATFIRELIRQAKGALAACDKWISAVEEKPRVPLPEIEGQTTYQLTRPELNQ